MTLLGLIWVHFVADFLCQDDEMAVKKSESFLWLAAHGAIYAFPFTLLWGPAYGVLNGVLHVSVDFFTSKASSYFWRREQRHMFFVTIGLDQAVHLTTLVLTYAWLHG